MPMLRLLLTGVALSSLGLAACGGESGSTNDQSAAAGEQGFDAFEDAEGFTTVAALVEKAELKDMLEGPGSYTLFAPSDAAFAAIPEDQRKVLESEDGRPQLVALLRQHMAPGYFTAEDISKAIESNQGRVELASLGTAPIAVRVDGETLMLGEGEESPRVVGQPVRVGNSLVHRIDRFLPPPPAE